MVTDVPVADSSHVELTLTDLESAVRQLNNSELIAAAESAPVAAATGLTDVVQWRPRQRVGTVDHLASSCEKNPPLIQRLLKFVYNIKRGEVLGAKCVEWMKLIAFFIVFYTVVFVGLFAGLIGATPGLSIYPNPLRAAETNKKNDTLVKIAKLAVIYSYKQLGAPTNANPVADNSDVARRITWQEEQMHAGIHDQAIDYGDLETCKHHFGYTTGEPCFGIAVNRVIDWKLPKLTETVCKHVCAMRILNCAQLKCQLTSLLYESDINTCAVNDQFSTNAHLLCYGYQPADRFHAPLLFRCVYARVDQHMRRYYPAAGLRHTTVEYEHIASGADQLKSKIFVVQAVNMPCGVLNAPRPAFDYELNTQIGYAQFALLNDCYNP